MDDSPMLAMPPSSTGFSEMLCRMSGLISRKQLAQLRHAGNRVRRRQAAALPGQRMRDEALCLDRFPALVQPRRDVNFVARGLRRAGHG